MFADADLLPDIVVVQVARTRFADRQIITVAVPGGVSSHRDSHEASMIQVKEMTVLDHPRPDVAKQCDIGLALLSSLTGSSVDSELADRRRHFRHPFPQLIHITPVTTDKASARDNTIVVVGKDLSKKTLGFFHRQPLPHRRVVASIETHERSWIAFLLDLSWCRFLRRGWYENGGRLIRIVPSPFDV